MNAYIDLSYIFHVFLVINSCILSKNISNLKIKMKNILLISISSILIYFNVLFAEDRSIYLNTIYYISLFYIIYKKKFVVSLISFVFSYYSQVAIIKIFTNTIYLYRGIVMLYTPKSFMYILISPLIILIIGLISKSIKSLRLLKKYRYDVKLVVGDKTVKTNAYFDSGNTVKFKNLPVVFLTNELKDKNVCYEKLLIEGIGYQNSEYKKGKILFEEKEKEVYFAYVNKRSFNGCKCLLNVYLLK